MKFMLVTFYYQVMMSTCSNLIERENEEVFPNNSVIVFHKRVYVAGHGWANP